MHSSGAPPPLLQPPNPYAGASQQIAAKLPQLSRAPFFVAGVLLLLLVVIPIALVRRARTVGAPIAAGAEDGSDTRVVLPDVASKEGAVQDAGVPGPLLSEIAVQGCGDLVPKRGPAEPCDHPVGLEDVMRAAARESASCLPRGASGGALPVVVDLAFVKKRGSAAVAIGKDGRTLRDPRLAQRCATKLKERVEANLGDLGKRDRARYKLAFVVTYPPGLE